MEYTVFYSVLCHAVIHADSEKEAERIALDTAPAPKGCHDIKIEFVFDQDGNKYIGQGALYA